MCHVTVNEYDYFTQHVNFFFFIVIHCNFDVTVNYFLRC